MNKLIIKELCNTSVLVLTHVKGHVCAGIGGAIKNLGMGAVTKITKERIHEEAKPVYISGCVKCGRCVERCPENAIKLGKEGPVIDMERCHGCSGCILSCPVKALEPKTEIFDVLLTEAAMAAISKFRKVYYVNFLVRMGKECDCVNKPVEIIVDDIGVLASSDILSIEQVNRLLEATNKLSYKVFFFTIYSMGLRLGEGIRLTVEDIDSLNMRVHIRNAKGNKDRLVPLPEKTLSVLRKFWSVHKHPYFLFPNRKRGLNNAHLVDLPLERAGIQTAMKAVVRQLGIKKNLMPFPASQLRNSSVRGRG